MSLSLSCRLVAACPASSVVRCFATGVSAGTASADKSGGGTGFARTEAGLNELYMRAVEPKPIVVPALSEEEKKRYHSLSSTYVKLMWKRNNVQQRDLSRKLKLKWAAIAALPTLDDKMEALTISPYVPLWRRIPAITPPTRGFHGDEVAVAPRPASDADSASVGSGSAQASVGSGAVAAAPASVSGGKPKSAALLREEKRKAALNVSLAAALRKGRGREEDDSDSLFSAAPSSTTMRMAAPVEATPSAAAAAPPPKSAPQKGKGKK